DGHDRDRRPALLRRGLPPVVRGHRRDHGGARLVDGRHGVREVPRPMDVGAANLAVDVLLAVGVISMFVCVVGVVVMRTTFDRMHYAAAGTTVPPFFFLAAVLVREGLSAGGLE